MSLEPLAVVRVQESLPTRSEIEAANARGKLATRKFKARAKGTIRDLRLIPKQADFQNDMRIMPASLQSPTDYPVTHRFDKYSLIPSKLSYPL
jgi:hypothetical protein